MFDNFTNVYYCIILNNGDCEMDEKVDLRIIKTRTNLYQTLEDLLKSSSFEEIKVSDICSYALINRSTFYAHYNDKYELLSDYIENRKNMLAKELEKNSSIKNTKEYYLELIKLLLDYMDEKKDVYLKIMINNKNSITMDIIYDAVSKDIIKHINSETINGKVPSEIISHFYIGAVFNVCVEWLSYSNKYSKDDIISYIDALIPNDLF